MSSPTSEQFAEFFHAVNGKDPFPWQRALAERVCAGGGTWPRVLDLPTASGKTACIEIAIFAIACQAFLHPSERTAPRRIIFVVDRRVIVDQAFERAKKLAGLLRTEPDNKGARHPILKQVAETLRDCGGLTKEDAPLVCFQLRGGLYRDHAWARTPTQPTVIASTVDQIGSRLLFRGYGVSDSLKPIHAGLVGNDSLVLLDEAHCSRPFLRTLRAVSEYRLLGSAGPPATPFQIVTLSATVGTEPDECEEVVSDVLRLSEEDRKPKYLGPRLSAPKTVTLLSAPRSTKGQDRLAKVMVEQAARMVRDHDLRIVAVFVNRVRTAKDVYHMCIQGPPLDGCDTALMIGRMRPHDRDLLINVWEPRLRSDSHRQKPARPVIVVATQCLEVGADFDFDALVTECASLDALRQRFGRLNRLGRPIQARGAIVMRSEQTKSEEEIEEGPPEKKDPIYGDALPRTWNWLCKNASRMEHKTSQEQLIIDFGINAFESLLPDEPKTSQELLERLRAPSADSPVMLPAHLDCWVQTAPCPDPDPDVSLFLHGPERGQPEVGLCWRADLNTNIKDDEERRRRWVEAVSLCPPSSFERMPVPLYLVRDWLSGEARADDASDLEDAKSPVPVEEEGTLKKALLWRGPEDDRTRLIQSTGDLHPGDTLVIPFEEGGWETLGHIPLIQNHATASEGDYRHTVDFHLAEIAHRAARRRAVLRLHPTLIDAWPDGETRSALRRVACEEEEPTESVGELRQKLRDLSADERFPVRLRDLAKELARDNRLKIQRHPDHPSNAPPGLDGDELRKSFPGGLVVLGSRLLPRLSDYESSPDSTSTEDEFSSSTVSVPIDEHCEGVVKWVDQFASRCALAEPVHQALVVAGRWHDLGKLDPRFQILLHGGNAVAAGMAPRPLAKSGGLPSGWREREAAREKSKYPKGGRHEMLSVCLVEDLSNQLGSSLDRELVLHLIASHHGQGRPFASVIEDQHFKKFVRVYGNLTLEADGAPELHRLDSGVAERFWNLVRRYGWWGLAWLEAILRLSDHRCSEQEQEKSPED